MMKIKLIVSLVLALLAFIFIVQNTSPVQVNFLSWSMQMSIVVLLVVMLVTGIIIGWALSSYQRFSRNRRRTVQGSGTIERQKER